ncbi:ABC transporter ATP-binding protein [Streptomyces sp. NBC_01166]|uniref:ABC transporter ATP-binding protein n=1 Tax=Streptomyces sp. NBC_01166 TaxID=2903755 RepID=UPI00386B4331|nr:ABC transporter ATP-binding protein [Streptomyces sp. NBC_01166]
MHDDTAHLQLREVSVSFGDTTAVAPLDLALARNEFVSVVGTSGCGKSTLLNVVAGLVPPTTGTVVLDGSRVEGPGRDRGMVFQKYTLFPWMTAVQNVEFALRDQAGLTRRERRAEALALLDQVGLGARTDAFPDQLSGGMQQRVAIARALSYRPAVLLMDEPFGALDALTRRVMQDLLTQLWEQHRLTVLFVTHDIEEAVYLSDRVLVMGGTPGRIRRDIPIDLARPRTRDVTSDARFREACAAAYEEIYAAPDVKAS